MTFGRNVKKSPKAIILIPPEANNQETSMAKITVSGGLMCRRYGVPAD